MTEITLNYDQLAAIQQGAGTIVVRNPQGKYLGILSSRYTADEIRELEKRLDATGPWYTPEQVREHLLARWK